MKIRAIAIATLFALPLSVSLLLAAKADAPNQPCRAYLDTSRGVDDEINNCPLSVGDFSIGGTFSNPKWQASFWAWEPGYYILYLKNKSNGRTFNLTGFDVTGTTRRPQYRFIDRENNVTNLITFRYSDENTIRLQVYSKNHAIANELLTRESDSLLGGP